MNKPSSIKPKSAPKMPSPQQTAQAMTGKPHKNDSDVLHDDKQPLPLSNDTAVTIIKSKG